MRNKFVFDFQEETGYRGNQKNRGRLSGVLLYCLVITLCFMNVSEVQHELLLVTAEHSEETMEHCRLMLLLLGKFPKAISQHGVSYIHYFLIKESCNKNLNDNALHWQGYVS